MELADGAVVDENMDGAIVLINGLETLVDGLFVAQIHLEEMDVLAFIIRLHHIQSEHLIAFFRVAQGQMLADARGPAGNDHSCLLYTSPQTPSVRMRWKS